MVDDRPIAVGIPARGCGLSGDLWQVVRANQPGIGLRFSDDRQGGQDIEIARQSGGDKTVQIAVLERGPPGMGTGASGRRVGCKAFRHIGFGRLIGGQLAAGRQSQRGPGRRQKGTL